MDTLPELLDDTALNGNVELTRYLVSVQKGVASESSVKALGFTEIVEFA